MDKEYKYTLINQSDMDYKKIMLYLYNTLIRQIILWNLSKEDIYGYKLMSKIDDFFKTSIELGLLRKTRPSKIYPILKELRERGMIESYNGIHENKRVLIYHLTPKGRKNLIIFRQGLSNIMNNENMHDFFKFTFGIEYDIIYEQ
ncbi:PadR family transcriptional regulator [Methanosphaera sp. WGK6]|uniref:PadR family transcriptional regulator n=1 Tax=Methanosphaera sp. WGK6 TaxID=1561964 RepID=UPI00084C6D58|nr:helix-turn-helix transcriptional regulator [Methanosphaera sp. WGK6]